MNFSLAVIHQRPPAKSGTMTTWALLESSVRQTNPGIPGAVQTRGDSKHQTAMTRYHQWLW